MDSSIDTAPRRQPTRRTAALVFAAALAAAVAALVALVSLRGGDEGAPAAAHGGWQTLPAAPVSPDFVRAAVWTGKQLLVFGREQQTARDANGEAYATGSTNVAAAYDPAARTWRRLAPPRGSSSGAGHFDAAWTGRELLVWGPAAPDGGGLAFDPATERWRSIGTAPAGGGIVAWTGRELVGWGGGCCGDAWSDGAAYDPETNAWRRLASSPLAASQRPLGAWTGRELIVLVSARTPDGRTARASLARAAAYDPAADAWRRISPPPQLREAATTVWNGRELLLLGGTVVGADGRKAARDGLAYEPATDRWRRLAAMPQTRIGALGVWTGRRVLVWGGLTADGAHAPGGLAYDPVADRWSTLPAAPLPRRLEATATWTGRSLVVWGGVATRRWGSFRAVGAELTPAEPSR